MTSLIQTICCYIYIYIVYNVENTDNIAFTIGHVDNSNKSNATLKIYLDDKLYDTVAAIDFMIPEDTEEGTKYTIGFENYDGLGNEIPEFNTYDGVITVVNNTTPVYVKGDANSDGKVNVRDAAAIARYLATAKS